MVVAQALKLAPWWTAALVSGAVAAFVVPGAAEYLVYDRGALARGELWRLLSAHISHYSGAHLFSNVLVLVPAALLVEMRYPNDLAKILALSSVAIGVMLFFFEAGIDRYAGASGVSLALLTYAALRGMNENRRWRIICAGLLAIIATKLVVECLFGWRLTDWEQQAGFVTVPLSHATGAAVGLAIWLSRVTDRAVSARIGAKAIRG